MTGGRKPDLEGLPRKNGELVFEAPWQARAFGMAIELHRRGLFEWEEFRTRLIDAVASGGDGVYYGQWLRALERLLLDKGVFSEGDLRARAEEFASGERA